jgi:DNA-binding transcriptional LysR family regulator
MHGVDVSGVDLNLLAALDVLLAERSVTAAARRLGLGQPAVSHALARLRELFADPLLVRSGRGMIATPRAEALREPLARLLADAARLVRQEVRFDPATSTRGFTIVTPDLLATLLPRIVSRLRREAPRARLEVVHRSSDERSALEEGRADLVLGPAMAEGPGLRTRGLGRIHFGVVARRDHPGLARGGQLRAHAWTAYPHILVRSGINSPSFVAEALAQAGATREIGLVVPSFLAALVTVAETDLFFAAPRELLYPIADRLGLVVCTPPITVPAVPVAAVWHERFDAEPGHRFLRDLVCEEVLAGLRRGGPQR